MFATVYPATTTDPKPSPALPSVTFTALLKRITSLSILPFESASPVSKPVAAAFAGMPSVTETVAVCIFCSAARSTRRLAAAILTFPVSSPPMDAASVASTTASFAVEPVATDRAAAFAATVEKLENTRSIPAMLASETGSEKVTWTEVGE